MISENTKNMDHWKRYSIYGILFILGTAFLYFRSVATSPLYHNGFIVNVGGDAAHYLIMGKSWAAGKLPYTEMFDHKGPYIYFVNMLGYLLSGNENGIFYLQIINMFFITVGIYKITGLCQNFKKTYGIIVVGCTLLLMHAAYCDGDMVEEWCLPFIIFSTCYQIRFLLQMKSSLRNGEDHSPRYAFLYGVSFGICVLTRITNAVTICSGVAVIALILLASGKYKNLFMNALSFILGFMVIFTPFATYFSANGALQEMLYCMLTFNFKYKAGCPAWIAKATVVQLVSFLAMYFSFSCLLLISVFAFIKKQWALLAYYILCLVLESYLFFSGYAFNQYMLITMAQVPVFTNLIYESLRAEDRKIYKWMAIMYLIIFSVGMCKTAIVFSNFVKTNICQTETQELPGYVQLMEVVPEKEKNEVIAYGGNWTKAFYLVTDVIPQYKYYAIQSWIASFDDKVKNEIVDIYQNGNVKWFIVNGESGLIENLLNEKYACIAENGGYQLYHLKDGK